MARSDPFTDQRDYQVTVTRPILTPPAVLGHLLTGTGLDPDDIRFLDLIGNRNGRLDIGDVRAWLVEGGQIAVAKAPASWPLLEGAARGEPRRAEADIHAGEILR